MPDGRKTAKSKMVKALCFQEETARPKSRRFLFHQLIQRDKAQSVILDADVPHTLKGTNNLRRGTGAPPVLQAVLLCGQRLIILFETMLSWYQKSESTPIPR